MSKADFRKWDYLTVYHSAAFQHTPLMQADLDAMGDAGWELVSVAATISGFRLFFKRPWQPKEKHDEATRPVAAGTA